MKGAGVQEAQKQDQMQIRLPSGMRDFIKLEAFKNKRSMNAEIIYRLESAYGEENEKAGSPTTA